MALVNELMIWGVPLAWRILMYMVFLVCAGITLGIVSHYRAKVT